MKRSITLSLLLFATAEISAQVETPWFRNRQVLSCSPTTLKEGQTLTLKLGPRHGRELMITRMADGTGFMLVVDSPPTDVIQLMSTEEFSKARTVALSTSLKANPWVSESRLSEPVFSNTGEYRIYVSENLESERGGYWCKVHFQARQE
jgi:hypothetical protein